jgi:hypothetical protein
VNLPTGLCELVITLPYLVLLLFMFLCSCAVRHDLSDVLGVLADVAMVSSPLVGRGYHSASMVGNQSTGRVSLLGLGIVVVGYQTKCPSWFLHRMVRPRPPSACAQGAQKGLQATNRALDVYSARCCLK